MVHGSMTGTKLNRVSFVATDAYLREGTEREKETLGDHGILTQWNKYRNYQDVFLYQQ